MIPTLGRVVIFHHGEHEQPVNGAKQHAAIVTGVHGPDMVNLMVLFDMGGPLPLGSVPRIGSHLHLEGQPGWDWPARIEEKKPEGNNGIFINSGVHDVGVP